MMNVMGIVRRDGMSLTVFLEKKEWFIRIEFRCEEDIADVARYHKRTVTPVTLRHLLPKWQSLQWQPCSGIGNSRAVEANDGDLRVHLIVPTSSSLSDKEIVAEFERFIGNA